MYFILVYFYYMFRFRLKHKMTSKMKKMRRIYEKKNERKRRSANDESIEKPKLIVNLC